MHACFLRAALACAVPAASGLVITHMHLGTQPPRWVWTSYIGQVGGAAEVILKRNLNALVLGAASCVLRRANFNKKKETKTLVLVALAPTTWCAVSLPLELLLLCICMSNAAEHLD
ncbi:hypothetical protein M431DRAFT_497684 [Trichoderma harzianum CBS 226.95]|uniref:Secreted protein n=1 Tax=Trichoderma harzianum CBS 226.95 TaxID=983964 RepID=A0A2T4A5P7_TRIHA|nr:hypothetical protein M431DRAFT_497684 [Trichoderma harzianum CBS 226.95]PTB52389.1 hypothetical protein M431DRAFT_497684 [Trichoderma harzianum CBS 226.95]